MLLWHRSLLSFFLVALAGRFAAQGSYFLFVIDWFKLYISNPTCTQAGHKPIKGVFCNSYGKNKHAWSSQMFKLLSYLDWCLAIEPLMVILCPGLLVALQWSQLLVHSYRTSWEYDISMFLFLKLLAWCCFDAIWTKPTSMHFLWRAPLRKLSSKFCPDIIVNFRALQWTVA